MTGFDATLAQLERAPSPKGLDAVVAELCDANAEFLRGPRRRLGRRALPSREVLQSVVQGIRAALFPWHFGDPSVSPEGVAYFVGHKLAAAMASLEKQVYVGRLLDCTHGNEPCHVCEHDAKALVRAFAEQLPTLRRTLGTDAEAAWLGDPAATSRDEVVFCYPGMTAIIHHRIAHELQRLGAPLIARIISQLAHAETGIDIHPGAQIGDSFFVDHGTGVVIGETCEIGSRVRIYQGVTLGARSVVVSASGHGGARARRHPTVDDDVVIYAGATILGPIKIGRRATIGGNVWLTKDVPPGAKVVQVKAPALKLT